MNVSAGSTLHRDGDADERRDPSICGCKGKVVDIKVAPFNEDQAKKICPQVAEGVKGAWNGQWKTTVEGKMSVCGTHTVFRELNPPRSSSSR